VGVHKQGKAEQHVPTWRQDPERAPTARHRSRARALRHRLTEPERKLWWHLRHRMPLSSTHFRRQVPIGPYVADFCCLRARLIIEVDGDQHGYDDHIARDRERTAYLTTPGFTVLRFSNLEAMTATESVLEAIYAELSGAPPTPSPLPAAGRGGVPRVTHHGGLHSPPLGMFVTPTPNPSPAKGRLRPSSTGYGGGEQSCV
jgi:very-short-patch-repair endonuclease